MIFTLLPLTPVISVFKSGPIYGNWQPLHLHPPTKYTHGNYSLLLFIYSVTHTYSYQTTRKCPYLDCTAPIQWGLTEKLQIRKCIHLYSKIIMIYCFIIRLNMYSQLFVCLFIKSFAKFRVRIKIYFDMNKTIPEFIH